MSKRESMNVKVEADLVRKAKVVAAAKRVTLSDYVSGLLRTLIEEDLRGVATRLVETTSPSPTFPSDKQLREQ
ncbi:MAG TPA: hypothetical protein VEL76_13165 [Gemmataceae bacterium]|nr:hypothetical protein [Gemmataceae bacterium]